MGYFGQSSQEIFDLSFKQLKQTSILYSIPGVYSIQRVSRRRSRRLVNVKEAKKLAIMEHGSMENLNPLIAPPIRDTMIDLYENSIYSNGYAKHRYSH